jgi:hypothetical protein
MPNGKSLIKRYYSFAYVHFSLLQVRHNKNQRETHLKEYSPTERKFERIIAHQLHRGYGGTDQQNHPDSR